MCIVTVQRWTDYRLRWNMNDFDGLDMIWLSVDKMWIPDVFLFNRSLIIFLYQPKGTKKLLKEYKKMMRANSTLDWSQSNNIFCILSLCVINALRGFLSNPFTVFR